MAEIVNSTDQISITMSRDLWHAVIFATTSGAPLFVKGGLGGETLDATRQLVAAAGWPPGEPS